jgi:hypothetical protein
VAATEVKSAQELEEVLKAIEPGKEVKIIYKVEGKEVVLEGLARKSE